MADESTTAPVSREHGALKFEGAIGSVKREFVDNDVRVTLGLPGLAVSVLLPEHDAATLAARVRSGGARRLVVTIDAGEVGAEPAGLSPGQRQLLERVWKSLPLIARVLDGCDEEQLHSDDCIFIDDDSRHGSCCAINRAVGQLFMASREVKP